MPDAPLSEVCLCGGSHWHVMLDRVLWCKRCGCVRLIFEHRWRVPLDRADELASMVVLPAREDAEPPTDPGTPTAKKKPG